MKKNIFHMQNFSQEIKYFPTSSTTQVPTSSANFLSSYTGVEKGVGFLLASVRDHKMSERNTLNTAQIGP